jgi:hypothetical protein
MPLDTCGFFSAYKATQKRENDMGRWFNAGFHALIIFGTTWSGIKSVPLLWRSDAFDAVQTTIVYVFFLVVVVQVAWKDWRR